MTQSDTTYYSIDRQAYQHFCDCVARDTHDVAELLSNDFRDASQNDAAPVAQSPIMRELLARAERYAASEATVLLTGESGTGKEVLARYIHDSGPRANEPYVRVNCAALPESLIESELFGHDRGAFTGADSERAGRFEIAAHGTLLLDEISEIPPAIQAKLLRVLEEGEYQRVGSNVNRQVTARIIATSNRHLEDDI
ncbi:MAG: sigma-54 factor interaction domain-containing protein, partial [Planctomycetales bacterium]|nr:sigma-54 factor interaction domain-containing protein [Planctomycetales bacterium]